MATFKLSTADYGLDIMELRSKDNAIGWGIRTQSTVSGVVPIDGSSIPASDVGSSASSIALYTSVGGNTLTFYPSLSGTFVVSGDLVRQDRVTPYAEHQMQWRDEGKFGSDVDDQAYYEDKDELLDEFHDAVVAAHGWSATNKTCIQSPTYVDSVVNAYSRELEFKMSSPNPLNNMVYEFYRIRSTISRTLMFRFASTSHTIYPSVGLYVSGDTLYSGATPANYTCTSARIRIENGVILEDQAWVNYTAWDNNLIGDELSGYFVVGK